MRGCTKTRDESSNHLGTTRRPCYTTPHYFIVITILCYITTYMYTCELVNLRKSEAAHQLDKRESGRSQRGAVARAAAI